MKCRRISEKQILNIQKSSHFQNMKSLITHTLNVHTARNRCNMSTNILNNSYVSLFVELNKYKVNRTLKMRM